MPNLHEEIRKYEFQRFSPIWLKPSPEDDANSEAFECFFEVVQSSRRAFTLRGDGDWKRLRNKLDQTLVEVARCLRGKDKADRQEEDWYTAPDPWMSGRRPPGRLVDLYLLLRVRVKNNI
jgi:hypothetical protein